MFKNRFMPFFAPYMDADDGASAIPGAADPDEPEAEKTGDIDDGDLDDLDDDTPPEEEGKPAETPKQSAEENAMFAEMRRRHEAEKKQLLAQIEAERKAKSERVNEVVQTAFKGYTNPYTEKPIETEQDYEDYQKMYREDMLKQLGLSSDFIEKMISDNPVVKQAAQIVEAQQEQAGRANFDLAMAEISKINPNYKTFEDLQKMPNVDEFNSYVLKPPYGKGYDIVDAFRLINPETPKKQNQAETKDHLIKLGGQEGSGTEKEIPTSELAFWKDSFPDDKPAELRARYNRALQRQGE